MTSGTGNDPGQYSENAYGKISLRDALRQRSAALIATIAVEILVVLLLLSLGWSQIEGEDAGPALTSFEFSPAEPAEEIEEPASEAPERVTPQVTPEQVPEPEPEPELELPEPIVQPPPPITIPTPQPAPRQQPTKPTPARPPAQVYGPPDTGSPSRSADSERVGTAPNGEPLYRARWYREPTRNELAGYLSTASAPSSALIVCRTVPGFYVEDCELLGESPQGSQVGRAVLAAAWQFRVRPAVVGGQSQFGTWVRIRIDYNLGGAR